MKTKAVPTHYYAVFDRSRVLHFGFGGKTLCGVPEGAGSGLARAGDYAKTRGICDLCERHVRQAEGVS